MQNRRKVKRRAAGAGHPVVGRLRGDLPPDLGPRAEGPVGCIWFAWVFPLHLKYLISKPKVGGGGNPLEYIGSNFG